METKTCTRCDVEQPLDEKHFGKRKSKTAQGWRWDSWCRTCYALNTKRIQRVDPEKKRDADRLYRETLGDEYRRRKREAYARLSVPAKERQRLAARKCNRTRKLRVLMAYSSSDRIACRCCGEFQVEFLTLDHVNNDGGAHRKELGGRMVGGRFYAFLEKAGFPPGYQVLCMNCNWARHWSPERRCPHELMRQEYLLQINGK